MLIFKIKIKNIIDKYVILSESKDNNFSSNVYKISIQRAIDFAIIKGGLYVRSRRAADAYRYGGMTHKLKKVFNDRGIPPAFRDSIPVICDDEGVVWVPGLGVRDDGAEGEKISVRFCTRAAENGELSLISALKWRR